jgi:hypothetical protein
MQLVQDTNVRISQRKSKRLRAHSVISRLITRLTTVTYGVSFNIIYLGGWNGQTSKNFHDGGISTSHQEA